MSSSPRSFLDGSILTPEKKDHFRNVRTRHLNPKASTPVKKVKAALIAIPLIYLGLSFVGNEFVPRRGFGVLARI